MNLRERNAVAGAFARLVRKRDFYAGGLMILFGMVMALKGPTYPMGSLMHPGPGFMPTVLGVILIGIGIAIALTAIPVPEGVDEDILPEKPEWFAWACILASPFAFMLAGTFGGMAPAIFACVFVAASGDREATLKSSLALSSGVAFFGVILFSYILQIPMPIFRWSVL